MLCSIPTSHPQPLIKTNSNEKKSPTAMRDNQMGIIHMKKQDRYLCGREAKQDCRIVGVGDRSPAGIRIRKSAVLPEESPL